MTVRAKFKVDSYETSLSSRLKDPKGPLAEDNLEKVEVRTIVFSRATPLSLRARTASSGMLPRPARSNSARSTRRPGSSSS